ARSRSSSACARPVSVSSIPASIRASSVTRSEASTSRTPETTPLSGAAVSLCTTRCVSANAATWARWVTAMTWWVRARIASRRPMLSAARPPTPASTSSNTSVPPPERSASTTSRASITLESSPPEAPRPRGTSPAGPSSASSTWSSPDSVAAPSPSPAGETRATSPAPPIDNSVSSAVTRAARSSPAATGERTTAFGGLGGELVDGGPQLRDGGVRGVDLRQARPRLLRPPQDVVDVRAVLARERPEIVAPLLRGIELGHVLGQFRQVQAELGGGVAECRDGLLHTRGDGIERRIAGRDQALPQLVQHPHDGLGGPVVPGQRAVRLPRHLAELLGVREPADQRIELGLLPRLRVHRVDLVEAVAQQVRLARQFPRPSGAFGERSLGVAPPVVHVLIGLERRAGGLAPVRVHRLPLPVRAQQTELVVLSVHRENR